MTTADVYGYILRHRCILGKRAREKLRARLPGPIQSGHSCGCLKKYSESGANCVTQCDRVLAYMRTKGSITSKEAMDNLGCERLASRICDLRKRGHCIIKSMEKGRNRFDEPTRYARYTIMEGEERK